MGTRRAKTIDVPRETNGRERDIYGLGRWNILINYSRFRMQEWEYKPTARSYLHGTKWKTLIQPITACNIISHQSEYLDTARSPHGMVTARHASTVTTFFYYDTMHDGNPRRG